MQVRSSSFSSASDQKKNLLRQSNCHCIPRGYMYRQNWRSDEIWKPRHNNGCFPRRSYFFRNCDLRYYWFYFPAPVFWYNTKVRNLNLSAAYCFIRLPVRLLSQRETSPRQAQSTIVFWTSCYHLSFPKLLNRLAIRKHLKIIPLLSCFIINLSYFALHFNTRMKNSLPVFCPS